MWLCHLGMAMLLECLFGYISQSYFVLISVYTYRWDSPYTSFCPAVGSSRIHLDAARSTVALRETLWLALDTLVSTDSQSTLLV